MQISSEYFTLTIISNDTVVEYSMSDKPLKASLGHKVAISHIDSVNISSNLFQQALTAFHG